MEIILFKNVFFMKNVYNLDENWFAYRFIRGNILIFILVLSVLPWA